MSKRRNVGFRLLKQLAKDSNQHWQWDLERINRYAKDQLTDEPNPEVKATLTEIVTLVELCANHPEYASVNMGIQIGLLWASTVSEQALPRNTKGRKPRKGTVADVVLSIPKWEKMSVDKLAGLVGKNPGLNDSQSRDVADIKRAIYRVRSRKKDAKA